MVYEEVALGSPLTSLCCNRGGRRFGTSSSNHRDDLDLHRIGEGAAMLHHHSLLKHTRHALLPSRRNRESNQSLHESEEKLKHSSHYRQLFPDSEVQSCS